MGQVQKFASWFRLHPNRLRHIRHGITALVPRAAKTLTLVSRCGSTAPSRNPMRGCRPPGYGNTSSGSFALGSRLSDGLILNRSTAAAILSAARPVARLTSSAEYRWWTSMFCSQNRKSSSLAGGRAGSAANNVVGADHSQSPVSAPTATIARMNCIASDTISCPPDDGKSCGHALCNHTASSTAPNHRFCHGRSIAQKASGRVAGTAIR